MAVDDAGLSRRHGKETQLTLDTLAWLSMHESHRRTSRARVSLSVRCASRYCNDASFRGRAIYTFMTSHAGGQQSIQQVLTVTRLLAAFLCSDRTLRRRRCARQSLMCTFPTQWLLSWWAPWYCAADHRTHYSTHILAGIDHRRSKVVHHPPGARISRCNSSSVQSCFAPSKLKHHRHLTAPEWHGSSGVVFYIDQDRPELFAQHDHVLVLYHTGRIVSRPCNCAFQKSERFPITVRD